MASPSSKASGGMEQVDITQLNLPQLMKLREQLEQDLELFSTSMGQLQVARDKFEDSQNYLELLKEENKGKEILVPLTGSMYVAGEVSDIENVLVDIGTGYFVQKSKSDAHEFFNRRKQFVQSQMDKVKGPLEAKQEMRQAVLQVMAMKQQEMIAQQQQQQQQQS